MLDYSMPYHLVEEDDGDYLPKLSFETLEEALEFVKFAPGAKLQVVSSEELEDLIDVS